MQTEFRVKKNGFTLYLGGTWCEISNKYGVLDSGDVVAPDEGITEEYAKTMLDNFIDQHSVKDTDSFNDLVLKRVAYDPERKEYIQLRAVKGGDVR